MLSPNYGVVLRCCRRSRFVTISPSLKRAAGSVRIQVFVGLAIMTQRLIMASPTQVLDDKLGYGRAESYNRSEEVLQR